MISPDKTDKELVEAMKESLERDGALNRLKAELRYNLMNKILHHEMSNKKGKHALPAPPEEVAFTNELVRDYLDFMGYKFTASVFEEESQLSKVSISRAKAAAVLGIKNPDARTVPVLCHLVETCKKKVEGDKHTGRCSEAIDK